LIEEKNGLKGPKKVFRIDFFSYLDQGEKLRLKNLAKKKKIRLGNKALVPENKIVVAREKILFDNFFGLRTSS